MSAESTDELVFYVNGNKVSVKCPDTKTTLLQYLRTCLRLTGTKEACGQGGCGACTVMLSRIDPQENKQIHYSVNACLVLMCTLHGVAVTTIEGIGSTRKGLHVTQKRLAEGHGLQCGFCTPGIVMAMYTLLRNNPHPTDKEMEQALEGNLCRCTGYRPILDAYRPFTEDVCIYGEACCKKKGGDKCPDTLVQAQSCDGQEKIPADPTQDPIFPSEFQLSNKFHSTTVTFRSEDRTWVRPVTLKEVLDLKQRFPDAAIVMGTTSVGFPLRKGLIQSSMIICATHVQEMNVVEQSDVGVTFGAAVTLSKVEEVLQNMIKTLPESKCRTLVSLVEMLRWFAVPQLKNMATLGGSIMSAASNADLNPLLVAMNATASVASQDNQSPVAIDDKFFRSIKETAFSNRRAMVTVTIPFSDNDIYIKGFKQSQRRGFDQAIVNGAAFVQLENGGSSIKQMRLCFGGFSPTLFSATETVTAASGQKWDSDTISRMMDSLINELPNDSTTGIQQYRVSVACGFLLRFYIAITQQLHNEVDPMDVSAVSNFSDQPCKGCQVYEEVKDQDLTDAVGRPVQHMAADVAVSGEAIFIDDMPKYEGELFLAPVLSTNAHANIIKVDYSKALSLPGVVDYVDHKDVPGLNTFGPMVPDEEVFASKTVSYFGQMIGGILAESRDIARKAAKLVEVEYEDLKANLTIKDALESNSFFDHNCTLPCGDVEAGFAAADHIMEGEIQTGTQDHFYMEPIASVAVPKNEHGEIEIHTNTQSIGFTQRTISNLLKIPNNRVVCRVKRIGGGFGGKECRVIHSCGPAAIAAHKTMRPVRCVFTQEEDILVGGKRHPIEAKYKIGVKRDGKVVSLSIDLILNGGISYDLSMAVLLCAILSIDNGYKIPNMKLTGRICKTNVASNTAFRGLGAPQANLIIEELLFKVSRKIGKTYKEVQEINLYQEGDITHFNQPITDGYLRQCWKQCLTQSMYEDRRIQADKFNSQNRWKKRGMAMMPVKFGIGMRPIFLNQAGALIHIYTDGSVLLAHGGVEMGQGLHTKMIQVASRALSVPIERIYTVEASSNTVPNASATVASTGSHLNGLAVVNACKTLSDRLAPYKAKNQTGKWEEWVLQAYMDRVSLSATGFSSPRPGESGYDINTNTGTPYDHFTFGAACSEVEIDCLTGEYQILRTDIVMDVGQSLNPAIDIGQIEGGFVQGLGYVTTEQFQFSANAEPLSRGPQSYKIPTIRNIPRDFRVSLLKESHAQIAVYSSKGIGEPPLMLAISVFFAIKDAIVSARKDAGNDMDFRFEAPATVEKVRLACHDHILEKCKNIDSSPPFKEM